MGITATKPEIEISFSLDKITHYICSSVSNKIFSSPFHQDTLEQLFVPRSRWYNPKPTSSNYFESQYSRKKRFQSEYKSNYNSVFDCMQNQDHDSTS